MNFKDLIEFEADDFPLDRARVEVDLRFVTDEVPLAARDTLVAAALRRIADAVDGGSESGDRRLLRRPAAPAATETRARAMDGVHPGAASEVAKSGASEGGPQVDPRVARSVHRILAAIAAIEGRGRDPTMGAVVLEADVSHPTVAKALDPDSQAGRYASGLLRAHRHGRTRILALTDEGREMARAIEEGHLPA